MFLATITLTLKEVLKMMFIYFTICLLISSYLHQEKMLKTMPLTSWDIYIEGYHTLLTEAKKKLEAQQAPNLTISYNWAK